MRTPSSYTGARRAELQVVKDPLRNTHNGPAHQRESLNAWLSPARPQNASMPPRGHYPPLPVMKVATLYDSSGGGARLIATQQNTSVVGSTSSFSMEAIHAAIQGERENTQQMVTASANAVRAAVNEQIAALTQEAARAREETAKAVRDLQASQQASIAAAVTAGIQASMNQPSFFDRLASAIVHQRADPPVNPPKENVET